MYKEDADGKIITCAVVIINSKGDILGCHGTGKDKLTGYDFPKGCADDGESDLEAALRELHEETGIVITDIKNIVDCGVYTHNNKKNIHIFMYKTENFPDIKNLKCTTYFSLHGKEYPEIDDYEIIHKHERYRFNKVLSNKFEIIDKFNQKSNG